MSGEKGLGLKHWLTGPGKNKVPVVSGPEKPLAADIHRVAVLPFANMSPSSEDEYFADGMTEELISALSKLPGLHVISRTSVMQYKKQTKPVADIGRELSAGTLLEGSVRKAGNRVRIAVQLIDTSSDNHLWAENYDRNLDDIFAIQTDVASKVSESLKTGVFLGPPNQTRDIDAYMIYVRAMQLAHESAETNLRKAMALLENVVQRDPSLVQAHIGLATLWLRMGNYGYENYVMTLDKALAEAQKAIELQPSSAEAHAIAAETLEYQDRFDEAMTEAATAVRLSSNVPEAYFTLGLGYAQSGRLDRSLEFFRKCIELDPLSTHKARTFALVSIAAGDVNEAKALLTKLQPLYPQDPTVYLGLADCSMFDRDFETAQKMLDHGLSISPTETLLLIDQGMLHAFTGNREKAKATLRRLQENKSESVRIYSKTFIEAALGNLDEAFKALMRGAEIHVWSFLIKTLPVFQELRKDPRFREFLVKVKLPVDSGADP